METISPNTHSVLCRCPWHCERPQFGLSTARGPGYLYRPPCQSVSGMPTNPFVQLPVQDRVSRPCRDLGQRNTVSVSLVSNPGWSTGVAMSAMKTSGQILELNSSASKSPAFKFLLQKNSYYWCNNVLEAFYCCGWQFGSLILWSPTKRLEDKTGRWMINDARKKKKKQCSAKQICVNLFDFSLTFLFLGEILNTFTSLDFKQLLEWNHLVTRRNVCKGPPAKRTGN